MKSVNSQRPPIVQISSGLVQGTNRTNFDGDNFYAFLSMPFGKAPVGNSRFKAPQPAEPWEGVRDATKQGPSCIQSGITSIFGGGVEDCLTLHVFTKSLPSEEQELQPVMVFIPGGGFVVGSNTINLYGPDYLLTENIVLATIQYRLGILGFLSLKNTSLDCPGNAGLKDQTLALKWVKENIQYFNGDPNNVTLFGESAGAASVEYQVLSPSAEGLFHRAVMDSGSTLNNWARGNLSNAEFSKYLFPLDFTPFSEENFLQRLQDMPASYLGMQQYTYSVSINYQDGLYGPVIEEPNPTAFITEHPIDIIQSGNYNTVPVLMGFNSNEGLIVEFFKRLRPFSWYWPTIKLLPWDTNFNDSVEVQGMTDIITEFYDRPENIGDKHMRYSDSGFVNGVIPSAINQAIASPNPVYFYRFDVDAGLNLLKIIGLMQNFPGACHGDEIGYLFTNIIFPLATKEPEISAVRRMVKMWTNFAKWGNPTPNMDDFINVIWPPVAPNSFNYLDIGTTILVPLVNPLPDRMDCWKRVYELNPITRKFFP